MVFASVALLASASIASAASLNVGVLDVQKVMQQIPQVTAMQKQLKKQFAPQEKQITTSQNKLKADLTKFSKNSTVMKDSDKKAMQKKLLGEQSKLRGLQVSFQQKLLAAQRSSMQKIVANIETAVKGVAKTQGLNIVLTKASVAFNDPKMDITDQVINKLK